MLCGVSYPGKPIQPDPSPNFPSAIVARMCKRLTMQGARSADRRRHTRRHVEKRQRDTLEIQPLAPPQRIVVSDADQPASLTRGFATAC